MLLIMSHASYVHYVKNFLNINIILIFFLNIDPVNLYCTC